jgi:hypothetical protein
MSSSSSHRSMHQQLSESADFFVISKKHPKVCHYAVGTDREVTLHIETGAPKTAEQYYRLAIALRDHDNYEGHLVKVEGISTDSKTMLRFLEQSIAKTQQHCDELMAGSDALFAEHTKMLKLTYQALLIERESIQADASLSAEAKQKKISALTIKLVQVADDFAIKESEPLALQNYIARAQAARQSTLEMEDSQSVEPGTPRLSAIHARERLLITDLFIRAAHLGYAKAKAELTFTEFTYKDSITIKLPKRFQQDTDLEMLAKDLKKHGGTYTYYTLKNPDHAEQLSDTLLMIVSQLRMSAKSQSQHTQELSTPRPLTAAQQHGDHTLHFSNYPTEKDYKGDSPALLAGYASMMDPILEHEEVSPESAKFTK